MEQMEQKKGQIEKSGMLDFSSTSDSYRQRALEDSNFYLVQKPSKINSFRLSIIKWNKSGTRYIIGKEVLNMEKNVLSILIDNCTNERLDAIALQNPDYTEAIKRASATLDALDSTLTPEQRRLLDNYTTAQNASSAIYSRLAYEQGMRDIAELWQNLTEK